MKQLSRNIRRLLNIFLSVVRLSPKTVFEILQKYQETPPHVVVRTSKFGQFCGLENDYLFKSALQSGSNEPHFDEIVARLIKEDSIVLDVGANIGTHSILLSKAAKKGHVYSFEPQSLVFSILQNNLILNGRKNVTAYRFAVTDSNHLTLSMEPFFYHGKETNNGAIRVDKKGGRAGDFVLTRTLDSFNFERVDFIKMDIQGSEVAALIGAKNLIRKCRPFLFVEIEEQHLRALGYSAKELIEKVLSLGYALYRIENAYPCDHICIPLEKVLEFERLTRENFSFQLSNKIAGSQVILNFESDESQNYSSIEVTG